MGRGRGATANVGLSEFELRDKVAKGERAKERLNILSDYFETVESNIIDIWKATKSDNKDEREELWQKYHVLSELKRAIILDITHGKQALKKLEDSK